MIVGENDLATTHPELAKEADGWDPKTISAGSQKKMMWKCKKGHHWIAVTVSRRNGAGCPVCSNRQVLIGFNDLATTHPELASEAHGWDPKSVIAGTHSILMWRCRNGHKWNAPGYRRCQGSGCPVCDNKQLLIGFNDLATTHPELASEADGWDPKTIVAGSNKKLKWKCKKGHTWEIAVTNRKNGNNCPVCDNKQIEIGINDLATTHPELASEADGWDPKTIVAGSNKKLKWKCKQGHRWVAQTKSRKQGRDCPICSNKEVLIGFNDLATTHPELASEADGWDPKTITAGSSKNLNWKCRKGHSWKTSVHHRKNGNNCPTCSNKEVLIGFNDLATTHPELASEADGWDPKTITAGSHTKFRWKCKEGHSWVAQSKSRLNGTGCPTCSTTGYDPNQNGYLYFLIQPNWEIYQIGITNVPEDRLNRHKRNNFELLELRGPMDGHSAQELETALLRYLKSQNADLSPEHIAGKFDGYSESWTIDSYKVNNLKELIDKTREAGF
jgi:Zn finger protein HypA/HybF involved in hydrogenase expression